MIRISGLCALAVAARSTTVRGQARSLSGVVQDSASGEAVPHATIGVEGRALTTTANVDGRFVLLGVPADSVTLRARALGYTPLTVKVPAGSTTANLTIALRRTPVTLDAMTVEGESDRLMKTGEAIGVVGAAPATLATLPAAGQADIFRSLQLMPGISGTNESSSGLYVRGGTPDQNLVLLDGMTVYHVDHFFGFFSAFNTEAIKDVQVYKGGFPAEYGGRVSSVVDLTGKTGDVNHARYTVGASLLSGDGVVEIPLGGRGALLFAARRSYTDLLKTSLYNSIFSTLSATPQSATGRGGLRGTGAGFFRNTATTTATPDFYFYDLNGKATYNFTSRDVVSLSLYNGKDNLDNSRDLSRSVRGPGGFGASSVSLTGTVNELTDWGNRGASLKWSRQWFSRLYSNALVAYSTYNSNYLNQTSTQTTDSANVTTANTAFGQREDNHIDDLSVREDNEWQVARAHKIGFGVWVTRSDATFRLLRNDTLSILNLDQRAVQSSAYLQDAWQVLPRLTLIAGGRLSSFDRTGDRFLEPRLSGSLKLTSHVTLQAAFGQYHQFVDRVTSENIGQASRDFWLLAGDEVPVTAARHYIAGASYENRGWLFDVEGYRKNLDGVSEFTLRFRPNAQATTADLFFTGTEYAEGVDVLLQKKAGLYTGWISYTLGRVRDRFPLLNGGTEFPALQDQTHELKTVNSLEKGRWTLAATWVFGSGEPYTAPESQYFVTLLDGRQQTYIHVGEKNSLRLPPYHRLDLGATYHFRAASWGGDVGISVFNLYNRKNVWYRSFDLTQAPPLVTDVNYLGVTPSISVRLHR